MFELNVVVPVVVTVLATEDKTWAARLEFPLFTDTAAIFSNIVPAVAVSDLVITFANILESAILLLAFATALTINLLTCVCALVSKDLLFTKLLSATDDSTCKERLELPLIFVPILDFWLSTVWILTTNILIVSGSDLVITFANIAESPSLLPAFATALSINKLTWLWAPVSKEVELNALASATDDKTWSDKFELASFVSDNETIFIIFSTVSPSDLDIIFPIVSILSKSFNIWV